MKFNEKELSFIDYKLNGFIYYVNLAFIDFDINLQKRFMFKMQLSN
jgi:hypothetical protein